MMYTRVCCSSGDQIFSSFALNFLDMILNFVLRETALAIADFTLQAGREGVSIQQQII